MNIFRVAPLVVALVGIQAGAAPLPTEQTLMWVPVTHVFSPLGADSNDNTQVVLSGYFPNLCYKSPRSEVQIVGRTIKISLKALVDPRAGCARVIVPILETVSLGVLTPGDYQISVNAASGTEGTAELSVAESTSSAIDDYIYGNLHQIERMEGGRRVLLKGYNPSDCFVFDRVEYISNAKDTFSVLPIMKQVRAHCPMKMVPFQIESEVPNTLEAETVLLHVRVMNGNSINALFENKL